MGDMGQFSLMVDTVNVDLIRTGHHPYVRQRLIQGFIQDKVTNKIGGDPGQDLMLLQLSGFMMRAQFSAGFL